MTKSKQQTQSLAKRATVTQNNGRVSGNTKNFIVKMKELVADVTATSSFQPVQLPVNPALSSTFPWLSQVASAYEKYKLRKLTFHAVPQCPATTVGGIGMYVDYDANDGSVLSKQDFFAMTGAKISQIWQEEQLEVQVQNKEYFTRTGSVVDSKLLYDHCSFNYFVESDTNSPNVLIFAEYEVELIKPQVNTAPASAGAVSVGQWSSITNSTDTANVDKLVGLTPATAGKITVSQTGDYLLLVSINTDTATISAVTITSFGYPMGVVDSSGSASSFTVGKVVSLTAGTEYTATSVNTTLGNTPSTTLAV